jgi:hypothetical protein
MTSAEFYQNCACGVVVHGDVASFEPRHHDSDLATRSQTVLLLRAFRTLRAIVLVLSNLESILVPQHSAQ